MLGLLGQPSLSKNALFLQELTSSQSRTETSVIFLQHFSKCVNALRDYLFESLRTQCELSCSSGQPMMLLRVTSPRCSWQTLRCRRGHTRATTTTAHRWFIPPHLLQVPLLLLRASLTRTCTKTWLTPQQDLCFFKYSF